MRDVFGPERGTQRRRTHAQTFVFFGLTLGTIFLLCGLAIDSGLLFLAKARMGRAVDGATLAAVGNFDNAGGIANPTSQQIRDSVAGIMRNFAVANYTDLGYSHTRTIPDYPIAAAGTVTGVESQYTTTTGETANAYTYNFNDGTKDANGQYRKFVQVVLSTGAGGQITSATCNARCPVQTYFIGLLGAFFKDLKVSASSVATRNPRLIMILIDRSGSMLSAGGGAYGLPSAIVQFLDFFDTSSDYIGIVSFGSSARVEMPLTTNFIYAGTNALFDTYQIQSNSTVTWGVPGLDPEDSNGSSDYDVNYAYSGVRRLKFGGTTAADDGFRLAMEQLMNNSGFNDPDVVKYIVLFTDGAWNQARTLFAAPGYTNYIMAPPTNAGTVVATNSNPWDVYTANNTNLIAVPTFCESSGVSDFTNAIDSANNNSTPGVPGGLPGGNSPAYFEAAAPYHTNDIWQSADGTNEPVIYPDGGPGSPRTRKTGAPMTFTNYSVLGLSNGIPVYSRYIDVWLQPGAVDYEYTNGQAAPTAVYVSELANPSKHISIMQHPNTYNKLVVPGYVADGLFYDGLDLTFSDNANMVNGAANKTTYPRFRSNNYQEYFMWPDDTNIVSPTVVADGQNYHQTHSIERALMFRNYPNLLTGFYVTRPDEPLCPVTTVTNQFTGARTWLYGLGAYYPAAGFYWPFDLVAVDYGRTYSLTNADYNPDPNSTVGNDSHGGHGGSRHESYSINMQSVAAEPEWSGEWFYESTVGTGTISSPNNTTISTLMASKDQWQSNAPAWVLADFDAAGENITTNETAHNTNVIPTADVWRPTSFAGGTSLGNTNGNTVYNLVTGSPSTTGGYVQDGYGNIWKDSMAWSGRPTHYFDFSQSKWVEVADNHTTQIQALPLGNWKVQEYAWHARNMGVTIYTVGYGQLVTPDQQVVLAQVANATNTTAGNSQGGQGTTNFFYTNGVGTAISYNPSQPIGQQFYATNSTDISNDFYQVGQAINAALTQ
jgi:hypothetical protein